MYSDKSFKEYKLTPNEQDEIIKLYQDQCKPSSISRILHIPFEIVKKFILKWKNEQFDKYIKIETETNFDKDQENLRNNYIALRETERNLCASFYHHLEFIIDKHLNKSDIEFVNENMAINSLEIIQDENDEQMKKRLKRLFCNIIAHFTNDNFEEQLKENSEKIDALRDAKCLKLELLDDLNLPPKSLEEETTDYGREGGPLFTLDDLRKALR